MAVINHFKNAEDAKFYAAGSPIYWSGDHDKNMYGIKSGEVEIKFNGRVMDVVTEGGIFGERTFIDEKPHATTAVAKTDCEIVFIDRTMFLSLVHLTPTFAIEVMQLMSIRSRKLMRIAMGED